MEPITKEEVKEQTAQVKETTDRNDDVLFVDSTMSPSKILAANDSGKKLIFDIVNFPDLSLMTIGQLTRENQMAYQMDARYAKKAGSRMEDGKSPYSEVRKQLEMEDPLHRNMGGSTFEVTDADPDTKYIFPTPRDVDALSRAGYDMFDDSGKASITHGVEKGDRTVIMGQDGKVEHVAMQVPQAKYDKHLEVNTKKSQARLGQHMEESKEAMRKYAPKVNIYDKSDMYRK